jgi:death on curing protein
VTARPWTPTFDDYIELAAVVLDTKPQTLRTLPNIGLAESAIHAPFASFGSTSVYPDLVEQAAVLIIHLVQNHPLPDGNKRAAFLLTARFLDANGRQWKSEDVAADASMVEDIAAGQVERGMVVAWIESRTTVIGS